MELVPRKIGDFEDQDLLKHLFPTEKNVPAGASLLSKICDPARLSASLPDLPDPTVIQQRAGNLLLSRILPRANDARSLRGMKLSSISLSNVFR